eukprot:CCRYP_000902-RA/>CCRYP_000902-RA protein AED:0.67 eAED:0.68 QI:0/0/0/1/1/1/2/0/488
MSSNNFASILSFRFDFQKKVITNVELLRAKIARMHSYGIVVDDTQLRTRTPRQHRARNQRRGAGVSSSSPNHPPEPTLTTLRTPATASPSYSENFAGADGVRKLNEAPSTSTGAASAVTDQIAYLTSLLHQQPVGDTEGAAYAAQSDSESSASKTRHGTRNHTKHTTTNRKPRRGRDRARSRSQQRGSHKNNPCKHCRRFRRHRQHPNIPEQDCFWNTKFKGFRQEWVCKEMGITYKPASNSPLHLVGIQTPVVQTAGRLAGGSATAGEWIKILPKNKGHTIHPNSNTSKPRFYVAISNAYSTLPHHATPPCPPTQRAQTTADHQLLDQHITWAEGERTTAAKANILHPQRRAIDNAHTRTRKPVVTLLQASKNTGYALATKIRQTLRKCLPSAHHVTFQAQAQVRYFHPNNSEPMITYDSGADGHYLSEADRHLAKLPILRPSTKRVGVASGSTSMGKHATTLPFRFCPKQLPPPDSFGDFPTSLMA